MFNKSACVRTYNTYIHCIKDFFFTNVWTHFYLNSKNELFFKKSLNMLSMRENVIYVRNFVIKKAWNIKVK